MTSPQSKRMKLGPGSKKSLNISDATLVNIFKFLPRNVLELKIRKVCHRFTRIMKGGEEGEATTSSANFFTPFHVISRFSIISSSDGRNTTVELNNCCFLFNHFSRKLGGRVPPYLRLRKLKVIAYPSHKSNEIQTIFEIIEPLLPAWRQCDGEDALVADICVRGKDISLLPELLAPFSVARALRISFGGISLRRHGITVSQFFQLPAIRDCVVLKLDSTTALELFNDERNAPASVLKRYGLRKHDNGVNADGEYAALLAWLHTVPENDDGSLLFRRQIVVFPALNTKPSGTIVLRKRLVEIFENARTPHPYELNIGGMKPFPYLYEVHFNKWTGEELVISGQKRTYRITRRLRNIRHMFAPRTVLPLALPSETLVDVFSFLDRRQLELSVAWVCRRFSNVIRVAMAERPPLVAIQRLDFADNIRIDQSEQISYGGFRKALLCSVPSYLRIIEIDIDYQTSDESTFVRRRKGRSVTRHDMVSNMLKLFCPFEQVWRRNPVERLNVILPSRRAIVRLAPYILNKLIVSDTLRLSFGGECVASELFVACHGDAKSGGGSADHYYADVVDGSRSSIFHTACVKKEVLRELIVFWADEGEDKDLYQGMPDVNCFAAADVVKWLHHPGDLPPAKKPDVGTEMSFCQSFMWSVLKRFAKQVGGRALWLFVKNSMVGVEQLRDILVEEFLRDTTPRTYVFKWQWYPKQPGDSINNSYYNEHTGETLLERVGGSCLEMKRFVKPAQRLPASAI